MIPNYDPALMVFKATGSDYTNITYEYAYVDQAGAQSPPTTYKSWTTTAESNSDRFEIERSLNGKQWEKIGTVEAQGESAATIDYSFKDATPAGADNYYRLKMIDKDLTFTYSGVRSVSFDGNLSLALYPNPVIVLCLLSERPLY